MNGSTSLDVLGYVAAICTTGSFVFQVVHVWRTRQVRDISLAMYIIFILGVGLWTIFGFNLRSTPVVLANVVTLLLAGSVLVAKLRFGAVGPDG